MKAYRIGRFGSVDGIVHRSSDDPLPDPREVLMRVRASSLNYRDLMVLKGGGCGPTKLGVIPLSDGAGEVALLRDKASWVEPQIGSNDDCFDGYPELSIEDWHKKHGLWIE
jgi:NADPH:quinone reductase-like Zn-dependent oxidoreductase